jgi:hypothetical protein
MANTGKKIYQFLKQIDTSTGLPTGLRKANDSSDPDYVAPVFDYDKCPLTGWRPINPFCVTVQGCVKPYVYDPGNNTCSLSEIVPATPPTISEDSVVKTSSPDWNTFGAKLYEAGYPLSGLGVVDTILTANPLWLNSSNYISGRFNVTGVTGFPKLIPNQWVGFICNIVAAAPKTIYIAMSAFDRFKIKMNGNVIIDKAATVDNVDYWHIYPVQLNVGNNYFEMSATYTGTTSTSLNVKGFGVEIYDNTRAEIIGATVENDLSIAFASHRGDGSEPETAKIFDFGYEYGYNCADGWALVFDGGAYVCVRNTITSAGPRNTGMKGFAQRERLTNGVADGYVEDNLDGVGLGTYFAPIQDLIACPIT